MYRSKKDVDKLAENLQAKLSEKEFQSRAHSIAHKYYEVGDYANCQKYVELYLKYKDNNAAAYMLLGKTLHKMGQKEKALEQFKMSLDIDPAQTSTILDICELLADDEIKIDPGRAKYWCEKAEATFPRHPVTFKLRERLITASNSDPEALVTLLKSELAVRPKDVLIHARLVEHYLNNNNVKAAFDHACNVEFQDNSFINNYTWYISVNQLLKNNAHNTTDWLYQLLLLTVKERICLLSITETPSGSAQSLVESNELLHAYDHAINYVTKTGPPSGCAEFHTALLQHHRGQFAFHAATLLLKKAKKDQITWRDATTYAAPLILSAWQTNPIDPSKLNWLNKSQSSPPQQVFAVNRWQSEGSYRCSQAGHYLLSVIQDKHQSFLDQVAQCYSSAHWRDKFYKKIFPSKGHMDKMKSSYIMSDHFQSPVLRIPRKNEVEAYDIDAQKEYGNSLHHFVWILLHYKNFACFKCTIFDMLDYKAAICAPETLNKLDIYAFLYCATLSAAQQQKSKQSPYIIIEKPNILPANITDLLCSSSQMKWWDCAYKFTKNELGSELTGIRTTLSHGIEVIRCMDNHGLDPELLCILGRIFSEQAKIATDIDEKRQLQVRACLYYQSAIPLLERLKSKIVEKIFSKRLFTYVHKELDTIELNTFLEECKLNLAENYLNDCEYEKVIEMILNLKSPQAYYLLAQTYKQMALEENNSSIDVETKSKFSMLLNKAKSFAFKSFNKLRDNETIKNNDLYSSTQELIDEIETLLNKIEPDLFAVTNDGDGKYSSDENLSAVSEYLPARTTSVFRNVSSTPKAATNANTTNYRTATDSQMFDSNRWNQSHLGKIENEIKKIHKRDSSISDFMEQTKSWFEENRKLSNEIISTIQSNMQNTTDQFKLLKISVDQVKGEIDECRNEYKDVGELKKDIAELKNEVNKLKKISVDQAIDESGLYNLDDEYRTNDNSSSTFTSRLPFSSAQVLPSFNQRIVPHFPVPPNAYQLYNQNFMNLYNQYSQFTQPPSVPTAQSMFDPTRSQVNYSGVYPTPDQMYLDGGHLVPPTMPTIPPVPPVVVTLPTVPAMPTVGIPTSATAKEISRPLPVNVVITSSDPLPTCTTTPAPTLSVTIPPKHIKGTPHNYQIPMPSTNDINVTSPPVFTFPKYKTSTSTDSFPNWNQSSIFKTTPISAASTIKSIFQDPALSVPKTSSDTLDNSRTVVDGIFDISPNISFNKSRTLSEKSNTSVENYDPCPDFKPIVPLPAEVKVTTGEEDEKTIFSSRAKLFRFVDKQWKERGIGEMKLLEHKISGKVRVLMRREQVHKICANHVITADMEIKPMKNETKAYFWVANDFADEKVVLEKFCVRFKTADIAADFYKAFENARQAAIANKTLSPAISKFNNLKPETTKLNNEQSVVTTQGKSVVGGFTFTSTPTLKPISDDADSEETKPQEVSAYKLHVFKGISFKSNSNSTSNNIFNVTSTSSQNTPSNISQNASLNISNSNKLNSSDTAEEFEPNIDFKPVIPLPALIDSKTGEEDETVLFEHRAKLLRFDATTKEWKERGLGNIKLLVHKSNTQKVRLLMRREQIMKICCNHTVTKNMMFQKMPNVDKAVTWCAKDFSEGELLPETLCLRFKTAQLCDQFMEAVKAAQMKMIDESKSVKEDQNTIKQTTQKGFGDKFKPKSGSWHCNTCYTNNLESFAKCACCETPKPESSAGVREAGRTVVATDTNITVTTWADKFKPKAGSWECQACLVRNEGSLVSCSACNSPRDPTKVKSSVMQQLDNAPKFNFGIPTTTTSTVTVKTESGSWAEKFKPKAGSWECQACLVRNDGSLESCSACNSPKDPTKVKSSVMQQLDNAPKFNFGIPSTTSTLTVTVKAENAGVNSGQDLFKPNPVTSNKSKFDIPAIGSSQFQFGMPSTISDQKPNKEASIFDGTGTHKFNFGIPSTKFSSIEAFPAAKDKPLELIVTPRTTSDTIAPADFTMKKINDQVSKPALLPTPQIDSSASFVINEDSKFNYVFKPRKDKSPEKSPLKDRNDESDDNEYAPEDECLQTFTPVIPLPDKVEVVTGEENETELYGHVAKLYRFISSEWKERGKGIVKILKHKQTGKLRVVMRREQILKICLNHSLTSNIKYTPKDEKSWLFVVNDFSEGELALEQFCLRFKNKEIASEFKAAIDKAVQSESLGVQKEDVKPSALENDNSDDVIFVNEIQATKEEKQKASELMLPENFFTYKSKDPCLGCRGCKDDDYTKSASETSKALTSTQRTESSSISDSKAVTVSTTVNVKAPFTLAANASTPVKGNTPLFQSPTNSIYGTPINSDKTVDTSIFRTPLGSIGSNSKTPLPTATHIFGSNVTNKENTFIQKPSPFLEFKTNNSEKETSQSKPNIFGNSNLTFGSKTSIIAPPKLNPKESQSESIFNNFTFGSSISKSVFGDKPLAAPGNIGVSSNKSIFDDVGSVNTEVKSIFGDDSKTDNLFKSVNQGSIFGPGALANNQSEFGGNIFLSGASNNASVFGSLSTSQKVETGKSIFGSAPAAPIFNIVSNSVKPEGDTVKSNASSDNKSEEKNPEKTGAIFSVDNSLSFATLSSNTETAFVQSTKNPDFKWEGAGEQLFVAKKTNALDKSHNESGGGDEDVTGADEEYDPHYAPIVPLPDKIVVTTGEEDEEKLFGERCKLYRYDENSREWKERGIGEMKILYHPNKKTYRLLLRREQVHKAVLNMLLHMDLELLQMKNSDRAWTWAGRNFAENPAGEQETLAVRFKSVDLAVLFQKEVINCVRKLQAAAAAAVKEEKETDDVRRLRLPKHLEESARADVAISNVVTQTQIAEPSKAPASATAPQTNPETIDEVASIEVPEVLQDEDAEGEYEYQGDQDYDEDDEYNDHYTEEEYLYHSCDAEAVIQQNDEETTCSTAHIQVLFDHELYSPKILITNSVTGEILADMVIHTDTDFKMTGDTCMWSGQDYTSNIAVDKTVTINFFDSETAQQFYESCETSKSATYPSMDPES